MASHRPSTPQPLIVTSAANGTCVWGWTRSQRRGQGVCESGATSDEIRGSPVQPKLRSIGGEVSQG